jgi:hypothetical protein
MGKSDADRRLANRRGLSRGGRRVTDPRPKVGEPPSCPKCSGTATATEAGAAEGGWWFVCGACDHLWDERARQAGTG